MYAVIRDRGKQYVVRPGEQVQIDLIDGKGKGDAIEFKDVLLTSNGEGDVKVGEPTLDGAVVTGEVVDPMFKGPKIDVVHFRRRKSSMTKVGHRQKYCHVKISDIKVGG
jgi:large subunit ribosomal protein L21